MIDGYERAAKERWDAKTKAPYCEKRTGTAKTVAELSPVVGDRFHLTPHADAWWEVKRIVARGVVVELWGTQGHLTLWENDMVLYPI